MESNVVKFPESKIVRESSRVEVIEKAKEKSLITFAENIIGNMLDDLAEQIEVNGLETDHDTFQKDIILAGNAIRSMVYRSLGITHPLQEIADNYVGE